MVTSPPDYAWLALRAFLRHVYLRVFYICVKRGLNGPRHDPIDERMRRWLDDHL